MIVVFNDNLHWAFYCNLTEFYHLKFMVTVTVKIKPFFSYQKPINFSNYKNKT